MAKKSIKKCLNSTKKPYSHCLAPLSGVIHILEINNIHKKDFLKSTFDDPAPLPTLIYIRGAPPLIHKMLIICWVFFSPT